MADIRYQTTNCVFYKSSFLRILTGLSLTKGSNKQYVSIGSGSGPVLIRQQAKPEPMMTQASVGYHSSVLNAGTYMGRWTVGHHWFRVMATSHYPEPRLISCQIRASRHLMEISADIDTISITKLFCCCCWKSHLQNHIQTHRPDANELKRSAR